MATRTLKAAETVEAVKSAGTAMEMMEEARQGSVLVKTGFSSEAYAEAEKAGTTVFESAIHGVGKDDTLLVNYYTRHCIVHTEVDCKNGTSRGNLFHVCECI